jgi:hypothetical protein
MVLLLLPSTSRSCKLSFSLGFSPTETLCARLFIQIDGGRISQAIIYATLPVINRNVGAFSGYKP